ncbi:hypothetical protein SBRCBS47491_003462 [Sporothrix bragantina]|uniref:F-box domain-containing protein n=1 Tax=Sporothrix bragantina TaxID=671064 RepID=A0ABP0BFK9_9PEZI
MAEPLDSWPLPGELIDAILDLLEPCDLARVSQVCKALRLRAMDNHWWQKFIQRHLPSVCGPVNATPLPAHLRTFRDLYVAHEAHWFLPRNKIWISGPDMVGKIIIVRYDPRRGCIEGYQLVAVSRGSETLQWPHDPNVVVRAFQPEVSVHLDRPVLKLDAHAPPEGLPVARPVSPTRDGAEDKEDKEVKEDKGKARAGDEPQDANNTEGGNNSNEQPPQKKPKISFYQPPGTSFSWGAYAHAINSDTPAIGPICPRIRPVMMDLDGSGGPATTHVPPMFTLALSSSSRIRRQFIFARPLSVENAFNGGMDLRMPQRPRDVPPPEPLPDCGDDLGEARQSLHRRTTYPYPQYSIWPPPELPAPHRVRATDITPHHYPRGPVGQPRLRSDISERAFHVRTYMEANVDLQRAITLLKPVRPAGEGTTTSPTEATSSTPTTAAAAAPSEQPPTGSSATASTASIASATADAATLAAAPLAATVPNPDTAMANLSMPNIAAANIRRDTLETYATIDPYYYTPTEDRPFRGIFVGDYSSHGCEFLLVFQDDKVVKSGRTTDGFAQGNGEGNGEGSAGGNAGGNAGDDAEGNGADNGDNGGGTMPTLTSMASLSSMLGSFSSSLVSSSSAPPATTSYDAPIRMDSESDEEFARRVRDHRIYQGSIRAVKLTGDPNVPRGEVSFLAPDLGPNGLDRIMRNEPFDGVRMVKCKGHIAGTRFLNDRWVETRLLLISPDRLAMFWIGFGHVSFFERVDIDKFVDPLKP